MKNLLSENMLRFGTKNLSESQKKELTLKSIMKTIKEHGLTESVKSLLSEAIKFEPNALNKWINSVDQAYDKQNQSLRAGQFYHANSGYVYTNYAADEDDLRLRGPIGSFQSKQMNIDGTTVTIPIFINPIMAENEASASTPTWDRRSTDTRGPVTIDGSYFNYWGAVKDLATAMKHANATPISVLKAAYAGSKYNAQFTQQAAALPDNVKKQIQGNLKTMLGV